jgi:hypothetical protein
MLELQLCGTHFVGIAAEVQAEDPMDPTDPTDPIDPQAE